MKLLTTEQIRDWDAFTIQKRPTTNNALVDRASTVLSNWIDKKLLRDDIRIAIICGSGNNAADGFCTAQKLLLRNVMVEVFWIHEEKVSTACLYYKDKFSGKINTIFSAADLTTLSSFDITLDAIFGSGINRPLEEPYSSIIQQVNERSNFIMSVDIPSGMHGDQFTSGNSILADEVLSFELPKLSFFAQSNEKRMKSWIYRSIGLMSEYLSQVDTPYYIIEKSLIASFIKKRSKFSHKGTFGHCLLIGGEKGKAGAIALSAKSAYRCGAGLVSIASDPKNRNILQVLIPEAMTTSIRNNIKIESYTAIGMGPGLGIQKEFLSAILLEQKKSQQVIVLDADALNTIAAELSLDHFPKNAIITPHPKEFDRLFGPHENDFERRESQYKYSSELHIYIVLKGAYTSITTPQGRLYFNETGNPGMSTGGSGDVLTGMITSFLGQQYTAIQACLMAVFMHGLAGDLAAKTKGQEFMMASDIIDALSDAWKMVKT